VKPDDLPQTESVNPRTRGLDELDTPQLVRVLVQEQAAAIEAVLGVSEALAQGVDAIADRLRSGGRLHYVGAGTSGRLGFLDASEAPPTFGTPPEFVCAHIAGGLGALTRAVEGAEDDERAGHAEFAHHIGARDAVVGLSASGGAPYVVAALMTARKIGAWTLAVANSPDSPLGTVADCSIVLRTGPEALTGSTRLKAGTSQKVLLNALSTAVMVRLGKVYDNLMVDVVATNNKLRLRALRLVRHLTGCGEEEAAELLLAAGGRVKVAAVMGRRSVNAAEALALLDASQGSLRRSL